MIKYFIYARKSTDEEDRQVLSISSQIQELKEFAAKEKLEIAASLCEAKTAKEPGRPIFNQMLKSIELGQAQGIIAWHPDRLARNSVDGGRIIYLVDTGKILSLKFPTFWFDSTPQGKFMLNIAFGQSKYFIDSLSENVKRGIKQKLRNGGLPGPAPVGYLNELKNHTVILDQNKYQVIKKIFELYATGNYGLDELVKVLDSNNIKTRTGKSFTPSMVQNVLQNPFYCGVLKHNKEIYQGSHEPIIAKKIFDQAQLVMANRGKKRPRGKHNFIFTGLMACGSCGYSITAETKKHHIYYHCTKKGKKCQQKYVREELLVSQFKNILQKFSLSDDWADKMLEKLEMERADVIKSSEALVRQLKLNLEEIKNKLDKLLDCHLDGTIDKDDYLVKKEKLINQKIDIEEKIHSITDKGDNWLEPMKDFTLASKLAKKAAVNGDLLEIKSYLNIIGSNFTLKDKKLSFLAKIGWSWAAQSAAFPNWQGR